MTSNPFLVAPNTSNMPPNVVEFERFSPQHHFHWMWSGKVR